MRECRVQRLLFSHPDDIAVRCAQNRVVFDLVAGDIGQHAPDTQR
jgi:hypothetical protein